MNAAMNATGNATGDATGMATGTATASSKPLLEVRALTAHYGRAQILFDVDLQVRPGEVVALMGRNGAGKTTTLRTLMGLMQRRGGSVRFDGHEILGLDPHRINRLGLGWVPEDRRIFTDLTVLENLEVGRRPAIHGAPAWTVQRLFDV